MPTGFTCLMLNLLDLAAKCHVVTSINKHSNRGIIILTVQIKYYFTTLERFRPLPIFNFINFHSIKSP